MHSRTWAGVHSCSRVMGILLSLLLASCGRVSFPVHCERRRTGIACEPRWAVVVVAGDWCQGSTHDAGERSSCLLAALRADMRFDVKLLNAAAVVVVVDVGDDGGCD